MPLTGRAVVVEGSMSVARLVAVGIAFTCLRCSSDRLHPIDAPRPPDAPANTPAPEIPPVVTPSETPPPEVPQPQTCGCVASINDGCAINGRCDAAGACIYDTVVNGTMCTNAGRAGECIDRYCIPFDTQVYGPPPAERPPWCPIEGVGLPASQPLSPMPPVACPVYGAGQMAYGNCPVDDYPMVSFEDTSLATRSQRIFDLRWLKFSGVLSLRVRLPEEPAEVTFAITDFASGAGLAGYKLSVSDVPCDVGNVSTRFDAQHCEGASVTLPIIIDQPATNQPCKALLPGHIYYFNIQGGGPTDPGEDGAIDAGERLLITVMFNRAT